VYILARVLTRKNESKLAVEFFADMLRTMSASIVCFLQMLNYPRDQMTADK
jgi:hypothetical protein